MAQNPLDLELRLIKPSNFAQLSRIIDKTKAWKELLDKLSKPLNLTLDAIHLIDQQYHCGKSPTLALLNHWSISGRRRPTIRTLIYYLQLCNLKWAEDYVWREILHCDQQAQLIADQLVPPLAIAQPVQLHSGAPEGKAEEASLANNKDCGPPLGEEFVVENEYRFRDLEDVLSRLNQHCPRYSFAQVYLSTNRFCHRPFKHGADLGRRIGDGRFSSVFLAKTQLEKSPMDANSHERQTVAAKLLKSECKLDYLVNEINLAMRIGHENILELMGISIGNQAGSPAFMCLIYPFMENGSLLECLGNGLRCNNREQIKWTKRVEIAIKIGRGIAYLHTFKDGPIIHRDIKTANILIDARQSPKLGDFTLVRQLDSMRNDETQYSQSVIGTSVYMPPEAFRGDISTKFDVFSFGIVLCELLSGREPFDLELSEDLLTYISEKLSDIDDKVEEQNSPDKPDVTELRNQFLRGFLDSRAGDWSKFEVARVVFDVAMRTTEVRKRDRPEMIQVVRELERTLQEHGIEISASAR